MINILRFIGPGFMLCALSAAAQGFHPIDACYIPSVTRSEDRALCVEEANRKTAKGIAKDACVHMGSYYMNEKQRDLARVWYGWHCLSGAPKDGDVFALWTLLPDKYLPWKASE